MSAVTVHAQPTTTGEREGKRCQIVGHWMLRVEGAEKSFPRGEDR